MYEMGEMHRTPGYWSILQSSGTMGAKNSVRPMAHCAENLDQVDPAIQMGWTSVRTSAKY